MLGFRVWDIETKEFTSWRNLFLGHRGAIYEYSLSGDFYQLDSKRYITMQYTHLGDAMNREICEGDILNVGYLYLVKDVKDFLIWAGASGRISPHGTFDAEIIGNSMENPELLEKVKC